ncbi:ribonuclease inhibitor-like isoform X3 [Hoplias malabaricus]|uniref:ribonuclease inhibitor-like isoform X3 n=1 Tax=Hoplias malabaricus TaxID=27720 RepID=UPI0034631A66
MKFLSGTLSVILIISGFMETAAEQFKVVGPRAPLVVEVDKDLVLPCSLQPLISAVDKTVEWIRLDLPQANRLVHLYEDLRDRNEQQLESYKGRTALFIEELWKGNTSLKLSSVRSSDEGLYQCFVEDPSTSSYDDIILYVEVKENPFAAWKIVIICFSLFSIPLVLFTVWNIKDRRSKKQLSPAECSVIAFLRLHSEKVRKELNLNKYSTSEEGYQRLIPAISNCRTAQFAGCKLSEQSITTLTAALQSENCSLRELDLSNNYLQDSGVEKISEGLKSPHCKLETLKFAVCKIHNSSCETLSSALQSENCSLRELDLSNNYLQDSGVEKISAALKSPHCKLETLRLTMNQLSNASCDTLSSALQSENCSLRELDLSNNDLRDSGVEKISAALKSPHCKLETLRLAVCKIPNTSCDILSSALQSGNCSLRELDLSKNDLQDSGVEKISAALKSPHCKLETLRLALCDLREKSCENLGSALQSETCSLRELDLSKNDLQDSGVKKLSEGLKHRQCKLEKLRLSWCMITEKGCSFLASALKSKLATLKELDLTYNHPGESGERLLSDPHCRIRTLRTENSGEKWIKPSQRKCSRSLL